MTGPGRGHASSTLASRVGASTAPAPASPPPGRARGRRLHPALRWTFLTVVALAVGGALGSAYALVFDAPEELSTGELARGDIWPPTAPIPLGPEDGAVTSTLAPEFTWLPSEDNLPGVSYVMEFGTDPHFQNGIIRTVYNIDEPRYQVPEDEPFAPGVRVYWRVYALDVGLNQGPYSDVWSFTPFGVRR